MARYIGPTCRLARRAGKKLEFKVRDEESKCNLSVPPGQHGARKRRDTSYASQLSAKQALRWKYGLLERPFSNLYKKAARSKGATGSVLLQLLESRLDNVLFRMGLAVTRREARQLVGHKAVLVNGQTVNIASFHVKAGDVISVREKAREQVRIQDAIKMAQERGGPEWVEMDYKNFSGTFKRVPDREDLPTDINEQLVVELYSK